MKKFLFASCALALVMLSGCKQLQDQAASLQKQGEQAYNGLSQQADIIKTQALQTKDAYDQKSQQVVNAVDAVNKAIK